MSAVETEDSHLRGQIQAFQKLRPACEALAGLLSLRLRELVRPVCAAALVEARAKTVASFAGKIVRKKKYTDPLRQITDLCGARIVVELGTQVAAFGALIRGAFAVDEANSYDARSLLRPAEFGYRSVHYVVTITDGKNPDWPQFYGLKAEIQVRTAVQHALAGVEHDRIYKSRHPLPPMIRRESSRLAAQLEAVDAEFQRLVAEIDDYQRNTAPTDASPDTLAEEEKLLTLLLEADPADEGLWLRRVELAIAQQRWAEAWGIGERWRLAFPTSLEPGAELQGALGYARCQANLAEPDSTRYREGLRLLEGATQRAGGNFLVWLRRAKALRRVDPAAALGCYRRVYEIDPTHPAALAGHLQLHLGTVRDAAPVLWMEPVIRAAMERCERDAPTGRPRAVDCFRNAWFRFLLTTEDTDPLAWEKLMRGALAAQGGAEIDEAVDALEILSAIQPQRQELALAARWLRTARHAKFPAAESAAWIADQATREVPPIQGPVVLIAGDGAGAAGTGEGVREMIGSIFHVLRGTVVSGGTRQGVAGLIGEFGPAASRRVRTVGYLPGGRADDATAQRDERYAELRTTEGADFSLREPLQAWIDLLTAGIRPEEVVLFGFGGGEIAAAEYRMALAFGARVVIAEGTGRAADALAQDAFWRGQAGGLVCVPQSLLDGSAIEAVLATTKVPAVVDLEAFARKAHEDYLRTNLYSDIDLVRKKWADLREDYRQSNCDQIASAVRILASEGYAPVPAAAAPIVLPVFTPEEIERMAQKEHARWNMERLRSGWRYAAVKDAAAKRTPWLVPWDALPDEIKQYDRDAVLNYARFLKEAGLVLTRTARV
ncbi:MAG TPA: RyR domain-containing protein [Rariglobus sp.]